MEVYLVKSFYKWLSKQNISFFAILEAVSEVENNLIDCRLSKNLYKKRLALCNKGKRAGFRTIIAYKKNDKVIFLHGFAKNEKDNITYREKTALIEYASLLLSFSAQQLKSAIRVGELIQVSGDDTKNTK